MGSESRSHKGGPGLARLIRDGTDIPLKTNRWENDIYTFVVKRKISGGTVSEKVRQARDYSVPVSASLARHPQLVRAGHRRECHARLRRDEKMVVILCGCRSCRLNMRSNCGCRRLACSERGASLYFLKPIEPQIIRLATSMRCAVCHWRDELFAKRRTGYATLDRLLKRLLGREDELLRVPNGLP